MSDRQVLGTDTRVVLLLAGLIFLVALMLGVWKYRQMVESDDGVAHPYVDVAHRAALLYSFATLLIAVFVELSGWPTVVNLTAAGVVIAFFIAAIATYVYHGWRRDTDNQIRHPVRGTTAFMYSLIIGEIGGCVVLLTGFIQAQLL
jgi:peptidoglycan/LPS O-acetylase OafA/YrhL